MPLEPFAFALGEQLAIACIKSGYGKYKTWQETEALRRASAAAVRAFALAVPSFKEDASTASFAVDLMGPFVEEFTSPVARIDVHRTLQAFDDRFVARWRKGESDDPYRRIFRTTREDVHAGLLRFYAALEHAFWEDPILRPVAQARGDHEVLQLSRTTADGVEQLIKSFATERTVAAPTLEELRRRSQPLFKFKGHINGHWIPRPEVEDKLLELPTSDSQITVVTGDKGSGKSSLLACTAKRLFEKGYPVLGIKAEALPTSVSTLDQLGDALGFRDSLVSSLRALCAEHMFILVLDQLDAVCSTIDNSGLRLNALLLLVEELQGVENIRIVVSARPFELKHDARFMHAFPDELTDVVNLPPLTWDEVAHFLSSEGVSEDALSDALRKLLTNPQSLQDFMRLYQERGEIPLFATSSSDLQLKRIETVADTYKALPIPEVLNDIATRIIAGEGTFPTPSSESQRKAVEALQDHQILVNSDQPQRVAFAHQSWLDTVVASYLLNSGVSFHDFVLQVQSLLKQRPLVISLLRFLREKEPRVYDHEVNKLWQNSSLRRHCRHLLLDFIGSQETPRTTEISLVSRQLKHPDRVLSQRALDALAGKKAWWETLASQIEALAQQGSDETVLLRVIAEATAFDLPRTNRILEGWLDRDLRHCVERGLVQAHAWDMTSVNLYHKLIRRQSVVHPFLSVMVEKASKKGAHDIAAKLLEVTLAQGRAVAEDASTPPPRYAAGSPPVAKFVKWLGQESRFYGLEREFLKAPKIYASVLMAHWSAPIFRRSDEPTGLVGSKFREKYSELFQKVEPDEETPKVFRYEIVDLTRRLLEALAQQDPEAFLGVAEVHDESRAVIVHRLLAYGYANLPASYQKYSLSYLLKDPERFSLGGDGSPLELESLMIARAALPCADDREIERFIEKLKQRPLFQPEAGLPFEWRQSIRKARRFENLHFLMAIPGDRLPPGTRLHIEEESRALGWTEGASESGPEPAVPQSAMSKEQMAQASDKHILKLFEGLPDDSEWSHPDPERWLSGGSIQASRSFAAMAADNPERAFALIPKFSPETNQRPVAYALSEIISTNAVETDKVLQQLRLALTQGFFKGEFQHEAIRVLVKVANSSAGLEEEWVSLITRWLRAAEPSSKGGADSSWEPLSTNATSNSNHSVLLSGAGGVRYSSWTSDYLEALILGLGRRDPPEWNRLVDTLSSIIPSSRPETWGPLFSYFRFFAKHAPNSSRALLLGVLERHPAWLDSSQAASAIARAEHIFMQADFDTFISHWGKSKWPEAPMAIGKITALLWFYGERRFTMPLTEAILPPAGVNSSASLSTQLGVLDVSVSAWKNADSTHSREAHKLITEFAPAAGPEHAKILCRLLQSKSRLDDFIHMQEILESFAKSNHIMRELDPSLANDFLLAALRQPGLQESLLKFIQAAVSAAQASEAPPHKLGELARSVIPYLVTLHQAPGLTESAIDVFEVLLDNTFGTAEEVLESVDVERA